MLPTENFRDKMHGSMEKVPKNPIVLQTEHSKKPNSNKADFAVNGELPKGDLEFSRLNMVGGRHGENDWAQVSDLRFIQRLAGFSRMEQRFQLCLHGKKYVGPRPLIEPV